MFQARNGLSIYSGSVKHVKETIKNKDKELIYIYRGIWHHSMISRDVRNDVVSSDYTDGTQSGISLDIVFRQLVDT